MNRRLRRFLFLCLIALLTATHQPAFARFGFNDIIRVVQPQVKQQANVAIYERISQPLDLGDPIVLKQRTADKDVHLDNPQAQKLASVPTPSSTPSSATL